MKPKMEDVARVVVRDILTAPTCPAVRYGMPDQCGCEAMLVRRVQERFEEACSAEVEAHKPEICTLPSDGAGG